MEIKRIFRSLVGFSISAIFLAVAFSKTPFSDVLAAIKAVDPHVVLFSVDFFGLSRLFRALMWHVTTRAFEKVSFDKLFGGVIVGYLANNFLPRGRAR